MLKVYMVPTLSAANLDLTTSINTIVVKLNKYFHEFDIELTEDLQQADIVAAHAGMHNSGLNDVTHCHGLYWTFNTANTLDWHYGANRNVIRSLRNARIITVPSQWVADVIRRDMRAEPRVIPWGVDMAEWSGATPKGYVLWNKTRIDGVCTPEPLELLAKRVPHQQFVSTFGSGDNIRATGRVPFDTMRDMVLGASVYLATTLETFGIGTLEAMAAGVPVLGYDWGGTRDIVTTGVDGYLVQPGDIDGLVRGLEYCLNYRDVLGRNAKATAKKYAWRNVAKQFAEIYHSVYHDKHTQKPFQLSVVIPCHNYSAYVGQAIRSVADQDYKDFEIIVVDDGSTDNSLEVVRDTFESLSDVAKHKNISLIVESIANSGVARARNHGIYKASGDYIMCLDADDSLGHPDMLKILAQELSKSVSLGVVYTGLTLVTEDGENRGVSPWPPDFNYELQVAGKNQVPTCCLFRKEAWKRAGGYKSVYEPAEDAALWLDIATIGYDIAKVSQAGMFYYRIHPNSLSASVRTGKRAEPNWYARGYLSATYRPFAAPGSTKTPTWPVRYYINPLISVVIPVGKGHGKYYGDAIESVYNQTFWQWECIVVDDTGTDEVDATKSHYPFAKFIKTEGRVGAGKARNIGLEAASGDFVVFLDADDVIDQTFLYDTLKHYSKHFKYVYTDWKIERGNTPAEIHTTPEYNFPQLFMDLSIHAVTTLIPTVWARDVGGFDESLLAWEDSDFFLKLAVKGYCGVRLGAPLFTYRHFYGSRREQGVANMQMLRDLFYERYKPYIEGEQPMSCCGSKPPVKIKKSFSSSDSEDMIRVEYNGPAAPHTVRGIITQQNYGRRSAGDMFYIWKVDQQAQPDLFVPVQDVTAVSEPVAAPVPPPVPVQRSRRTK